MTDCIYILALIIHHTKHFTDLNLHSHTHIHSLSRETTLLDVWTSGGTAIMNVYKPKRQEVRYLVQDY